MLILKLGKGTEMQPKPYVKYIVDHRSQKELKRWITSYVNAIQLHSRISKSLFKLPCVMTTWIEGGTQEMA